MAETKPDEAEPSQPPNNVPQRDHEVLQQVLALLSAPVPENPDAASLAADNNLLRGVLSRMVGLLRDKTGTCLTLEKRVDALNVQVQSLKEVISISKDMLNIRNMEVQHLKADLDSFQSKMDGERQRHNEMISKLDSALKLNGQLKSEYETQLKLFQSLKEKYEQRAKLQEGIKNIKDNDQSNTGEKQEENNQKIASPK